MDGVSEGVQYANKFFWHQRSIDLIGNGAFGRVNFQIKIFKFINVKLNM